MSAHYLHDNHPVRIRNGRAEVLRDGSWNACVNFDAASPQAQPVSARQFDAFVRKSLAAYVKKTNRLWDQAEHPRRNGKFVAIGDIAKSGEPLDRTHLQGQALAQFYADLFNVLTQSGSPPTPEQSQAVNQELTGSNWIVCQPNGGQRWEPMYEQTESGLQSPDPNLPVVAPAKPVPEGVGTPAAKPGLEVKRLFHWLMKGLDASATPRPSTAGQEAPKNPEFEAKHPRDKQGHFVTKAQLAEAASDPAKAAALRANLDPANQQKLDNYLGKSPQGQDAHHQEMEQNGVGEQGGDKVAGDATPTPAPAVSPEQAAAHRGSNANDPQAAKDFAERAPQRIGELKGQTQAALASISDDTPGNNIIKAQMQEALDLLTAEPVQNQQAAGGTQETPPVLGEADKSTGRSTEHEAMLKESKDFVSKSLASAKLSPETHKKYEENAHAVLDNMSEKGLQRLHAAVKGATFYETNADMVDALAKVSSSVREVKAKGQKLGGGWDRKHGVLHLDGELDDEVNTHAGIYAHEMTHSIDGPNREISNSPEWAEAFESELKGGQLSKYATTSLHEGFAEFGRLVYGQKVSPDELRQKYPQATAVWEKHGLLPQTNQAPMAQLAEVFEGEPINDGPLHADREKVTADVLAEPVPAEGGSGESSEAFAAEPEAEATVANSVQTPEPEVAEPEEEGAEAEAEAAEPTEPATPLRPVANSVPEEEQAAGQVAELPSKGGKTKAPRSKWSERTNESKGQRQARRDVENWRSSHDDNPEGQARFDKITHGIDRNQPLQRRDLELAKVAAQHSTAEEAIAKGKEMRLIKTGNDEQRLRDAFDESIPTPQAPQAIKRRGPRNKPQTSPTQEQVGESPATLAAETAAAPVSREQPPSSASDQPGSQESASVENQRENVAPAASVAEGAPVAENDPESPASPVNDAIAGTMEPKAEPPSVSAEEPPAAVPQPVAQRAPEGRIVPDNQVTTPGPQATPLPGKQPRQAIPLGKPPLAQLANEQPGERAAAEQVAGNAPAQAPESAAELPKPAPNVKPHEALRSAASKMNWNDFERRAVRTVSSQLNIGDDEAKQMLHNTARKAGHDDLRGLWMSQQKQGDTNMVRPSEASPQDEAEVNDYLAGLKQQQGQRDTADFNEEPQETVAGRALPPGLPEETGGAAETAATIEQPQQVAGEEAAAAPGGPGDSPTTEPTADEAASAEKFAADAKAEPKRGPLGGIADTEFEESDSPTEEENNAAVNELLNRSAVHQPQELGREESPLAEHYRKIREQYRANLPDGAARARHDAILGRIGHKGDTGERLARLAAEHGSYEEARRAAEKQGLVDPNPDDRGAYAADATQGGAYNDGLLQQAFGVKNGQPGAKEPAAAGQETSLPPHLQAETAAGQDWPQFERAALDAQRKQRGGSDVLAAHLLDHQAQAAGYENLRGLWAAAQPGRESEEAAASAPVESPASPVNDAIAGTMEPEASPQEVNAAEPAAKLEDVPGQQPGEPEAAQEVVAQAKQKKEKKAPAAPDHDKLFNQTLPKKSEGQFVKVGDAKVARIGKGQYEMQAKGEDPVRGTREEIQAKLQERQGGGAGSGEPAGKPSAAPAKAAPAAAPESKPVGSEPPPEAPGAVGNPSPEQPSPDAAGAAVAAVAAVEPPVEEPAAPTEKPKAKRALPKATAAQEAAAKEVGADANTILQRAREMHNHETLKAHGHNQLLRRAKELAQRDGIDLNKKGKDRRPGGFEDAARIPKFDLLARTIAGEFPEQFGGKDPQEVDPQELYDKLNEGNQKPMTQAQAFAESLKHHDHEEASRAWDQEAMEERHARNEAVLRGEKNDARRELEQHANDAGIGQDEVSRHLADLQSEVEAEVAQEGEVGAGDFSPEEASRQFADDDEDAVASITEDQFSAAEDFGFGASSPEVGAGESPEPEVSGTPEEKPLDAQLEQRAHTAAGDKGVKLLRAVHAAKREGENEPHQAFIDELGKTTGLSPQEVESAVRALQKHDLLEFIQAGNPGHETIKIPGLEGHNQVVAVAPFGTRDKENEDFFRSVGGENSQDSKPAASEQEAAQEPPVHQPAAATPDEAEANDKLRFNNLAEKTASGDKAASNKLFEDLLGPVGKDQARHGPLMNFLRKQGVPESEIDDAAQRAAINILGHLRSGKFEGKDNFLHWAMTVASNAGKDELRRNRRHTQGQSASKEKNPEKAGDAKGGGDKSKPEKSPLRRAKIDLGGNPEEGGFDPAKEGLAPDEEAMEHERHAALDEAIEGIKNEKWRIATQMKREGASLKEIAAKIAEKTGDPTTTSAADNFARSGRNAIAPIMEKYKAHRLWMMKALGMDEDTIAAAHFEYTMKSLYGRADDEQSAAEVFYQTHASQASTLARQFLATMNEEP